MSNVLISNGSYGCVYHPGFSCQGNVLNNKKIVTKVQTTDDMDVIRSELLISNRIKEIPEYHKFFVPVLKSCKLGIGQMDSDGLKNCKIIRSETNLILMYLKYIDSVPFHTYILRLIKKKQQTKYSNMFCFRRVIKSYSYILHSIKLLSKKEIVHFDLHNNNLIYDFNLNIPLIIDFGLSVQKDDLYNFLSKNTLVFSEKMSQYAIEIHLIGDMLRGELTVEKIRFTSSQYIKNVKDISLIDEYYSNFIVEYTDSCVAYYSKFLTLSKKESVLRIIEYWYTWDNYAVGLIILNSLNQMIKKNIINKNNKIIKELYILIVRVIHPNPSNRLTIGDAQKSLKEICAMSGKHYNTLFAS